MVIDSHSKTVSLKLNAFFLYFLGHGGLSQKKKRYSDKEKFVHKQSQPHYLYEITIKIWKQFKCLSSDVLNMKNAMAKRVNMLQEVAIFCKGDYKTEELKIQKNTLF